MKASQSLFDLQPRCSSMAYYLKSSMPSVLALVDASSVRGGAPLEAALAAGPAGGAMPAASLASAASCPLDTCARYLLGPQNPLY